MGAWQPGDPPGRRQFARLFSEQPLQLEQGTCFGPITLAYESWGQPNRDRSNAVLLLHGFSGDSHAAGGLEPGHPTPGWWDPLIGPGRALDTDHFWVICPNVFGGCQGSSGPACAAADGQPYRHRFPGISIRDQVACELALAAQLGIGSWHAVIGGSMGGMRALEWALLAPERVPRLGLLATAAAASAPQMAWHQLELQALDCHNDHQPGHELERDIPGQTKPPGEIRGLALARAIALLSYGDPDGLAGLGPIGLKNHGDLADGGPPVQLAELAERLMGHPDKHQELVAFEGRFDAFSYRTLCGAMLQHDLGRQRGGLAAALARIEARTVIVSINSDLLFPPSLQDEIWAGLRRQAQLHRIRSRHGHDGFLLEHQQIAPLVRLMVALGP